MDVGTISQSKSIKVRRGIQKSVADPGIPKGVHQFPKVLLFFNFFAENCMKMKKFRPLGHMSLASPLDLPMEVHLVDLHRLDLHTQYLHKLDHH